MKGDVKNKLPPCRRQDDFFLPASPSWVTVTSRYVFLGTHKLRGTALLIWFILRPDEPSLPKL